MAAQRAAGEVEHERQVAVRAAQALATVAAQDEGRRTTAVDEQDRLVATGLQRSEAIRQRGREDRPIATRQLSAEVGDLNGRLFPDAALLETRALDMPA